MVKWNRTTKTAAIPLRESSSKSLDDLIDGIGQILTTKVVKNHEMPCY
jgi:hypothetical protein